MRTGRMLKVGLIAGIASLCLASYTPAAAQDELPQPAANGPLEIGNWAASAFASGTASGSEDGMNLTWSGSIPAQFDFSIVDDGRAEGTWTHQGSAVFEFSGSAEGQAIDATAEVSMSGGGAVSGTSSQLTLNGSSTTVGSVTGTVAGHSMTMPIDNTQPTTPMTMNVRSTMCGEAHGDWAYTVEAGFAGEGWATASFDGYWSAYRDVEGMQDKIDELLDKAVMGGDDMPDFDSQSPLMNKVAEILWRYNDFVDDYPDWAISDVVNAMGWAEMLINELRNLTACDIRLFGDDHVEIFTNGLTLMIQQLVMGVFAATDVDAAAWQQLAQIAARTGAIGSGSAYPDDAAAAEAALIAAGAEILARNLDADGLIDVNDDTKRVMATGAAMGWEFEVGGETWDARATFDHYLDEGGAE